MGKNKFNKPNEKTNATKILESVKGEDFYAQSTSQQAKKRQKIDPDHAPKRRDAIDDLQSVNNGDSSSDSDAGEKAPDVSDAGVCSVGVQTDFMFIDTNEFAMYRKESTSEFKKLRSCIQYDLKKMEASLSSYFGTAHKTTSLTELQKKLGLHEPISELKTFYEFDNKIKEEKEFADILRELMSVKTRAKSLHEAISGVLSVVMSHELQLKFSACGKPNKGVSKENLSGTQLYAELKDYLIKNFESETDATILSKTSRWLASAKDRCGGRSTR